jgi:hypothetical protein
MMGNDRYRDMAAWISSAVFVVILLMAGAALTVCPGSISGRLDQPGWASDKIAAARRIQ